MKTFRYWTKQSASLDHEGQPWNIECFGASNESEEDAGRNAMEKVRAIIRRMQGGEAPDAGYEYSDRPLREEVLEEVRDGERITCVLTRNAYGSIVLNTPDVLFADIDAPKPSFVESLKGLFGRRRDVDAEISEQVRAVAERNGLAVRLYRTCAGYRVLVTSRLYDPADAKTRSLLEAFASDPLYVRLCRVQESFRARLTPKPWRCGATRPPSRFPWLRPGAEAAQRQWEREYSAQTRGYATCRLLAEHGSFRAEPAALAVVDIHDRHACGEGELA